MNTVLIIGTINHIVFVSFFLLGCIFTNFQCIGDDMSSLLTLHGLAIFPFQIIVELTVGTAIVILSILGKWREIRNIPLILFIFSFLIFLYVGKTF